MANARPLPPLWPTLLALFALAAGTAYFVLDPGDADSDTERALADRVSTPTAAPTPASTEQNRAPLWPSMQTPAVQSIEYRDASGNLAFAIERTPQGWTQTHPARSPLNTVRTHGWVDALLAIQGAPISAELPTAEPASTTRAPTWTLHTDGGTSTIVLHTTRATGGFATSADGSRLRLSAEAASRLTPPNPGALWPARLDTPSMLACRSVRFTVDGDTFALTPGSAGAGDGSGSDSGAGSGDDAHWRFDDGRRVADAFLAELSSQLPKVETTGHAYTPVAQLPALGLDPPTVSIALHHADDHRTLRLGDLDPLAAGSVYAAWFDQQGYTGVVFRVPEVLVREARVFQPLLLDARPIPVAPQQVRSLSISPRAAALAQDIKIQRAATRWAAAGQDGVPSELNPQAIGELVLALTAGRLDAQGRRLGPIPEGRLGETAVDLELTSADGRTHSAALRRVPDAVGATPRWALQRAGESWAAPIQQTDSDSLRFPRTILRPLRIDLADASAVESMRIERPGRAVWTESAGSSRPSGSDQSVAQPPHAPPGLFDALCRSLSRIDAERWLAPDQAETVGDELNSAVTLNVAGADGETSEVRLAYDPETRAAQVTTGAQSGARWIAPPELIAALESADYDTTVVPLSAQRIQGVVFIVAGRRVTLERHGPTHGRARWRWAGSPAPGASELKPADAHRLIDALAGLRVDRWVDPAGDSANPPADPEPMRVLVQGPGARTIEFAWVSQHDAEPRLRIAGYRFEGVAGTRLAAAMTPVLRALDPTQPPDSAS
ncbi:MAG: hypothetical protein AAF288_00780 [Planctomycetota bacterium]